MQRFFSTSVYSHNGHRTIGRRTYSAIFFVALVLAVVAAFWIGSSSIDRALPSQFAVDQAGADSPMPLEPILLDGKYLNLAGSLAQTLVLPNGTAPSEAMRQFRSHLGIPVGERETLSKASNNDNASTSLYVWFSYKTTNQAPVLLRYRSLSQLLTAVWIADESGGSFQLLDVAGPDAPAHSSPAPTSVQAHSLLLTATLPASTDKVRQVLIRVDSVFPYWSSFSLSAVAAHERHRSDRNYLDGIVLGALLVSAAFALYGIYFRQTADYLVFLLASSAMCLWYLALGEHFYGTEWVPLRRLTFVGPVYAYFLLHAIGLQFFLYPKLHMGGKHSGFLRHLPLWLAMGYTGAGFASSVMYAFLGLHTPFVRAITLLNEGLLVVAPALLLLAVLLAPDRRVPAYRLLLLIEIVGAIGSGLQFVHSNSFWLDNRIVEALIQYPLPIEALIWAAALSARFNYLEMLAKRRVKAALRKEAKKVRSAMQATLESREQALMALDNSYRVLDQVRTSMLAIIDVHSHAAGNLLMRLGGHLARLDRSSTAELTPHISAAFKVLDDLASAVQKTECAVGDAQSSKHAIAPASSLLRWQADIIQERLNARNVKLDICIDADCEMLLVDGFHFMEVSRELLSNIHRYAHGGTAARVSLRRAATTITVCSENTGNLREDDQALRLGIPVNPASSNFSGEQSSGRGLATLGALLASIGGTVRYDTRGPSQVVVTVVLPLRSSPHNSPPTNNL